MIFAIILFAVNLFAKLMCDNKAFKEGGVEPSDGRGWLMKGALSFLLGKWHFWDAVRNMSFLILVCYTLQIPIYLCVIAYLIYGLLFNLFYKLL